MSDDNKSNPSDNIKLENFEIADLDTSRFIKPFQIKFLQNGKQRRWDAIMTHPGVSCIIFDTDKQALILVRQFRPVVYVNQVIEANSDDKLHGSSVVNVNSVASSLDWSKIDPHKSFTYELCAGLCDKTKSLEDTVREEIFEECGYHVDKDHPLRKVNTFRSVGIAGALHTVFYCEVNSRMKTGKGGGNEDEGEMIVLYELPIDKIKEFIADDSQPKPPGLLYALLWFLHERE